MTGPWAALLARFTELLPPGSYLVLSQLTSDGDPAAVAQASGATRNTATPLAFRSREQILSFFDGFDLVEPRLVSVHQWRPVADTPRHQAGRAGRSRRQALSSDQFIWRRIWLSSSTVSSCRSACTHSWSITAE
jgi:hypothetical protein